MCHTTRDPPEHHLAICYQCERKDERLDNAKDFFEAVLDMLYDDAPLDRLLLERNLDELAAYLNVDFRKGYLQIERKEQTTAG